MQAHQPSADVGEATPPARPERRVFPPLDWGDLIEAFGRGRATPPSLASLETETPERGPETARQPLAKTGERYESYERTETDRFGRQYTVRVTIRTVPMSRRRKR